MSLDITREAFKVLDKVDTELATPTEIERYGLFIAASFVETILFVGAAFAKLSGLVMAKSYESGLLFFEGIFAYPAARIFLLVVCVIVAVVTTLKTASILSKKFRSYYALNLALIGIYNVSLVVVILTVGMLLAILDPVVNIW